MKAHLKKALLITGLSVDFSVLAAEVTLITRVPVCYPSSGSGGGGGGSVVQNVSSSYGVYGVYGCYGAPPSGSLLNGKTTSSSDMTCASCATFCEGSPFFAIQNGNQCLCGTQGPSTPKLDYSSCNGGCSGQSTESCGSKNTCIVYSSGPPPPGSGTVSVTTYTTTLTGGIVSTVTSSTTLPPTPPGSISVTTYTTTLPGGSVSTVTSSTTLPPPPPGSGTVSVTTYTTTLTGGIVSTVTSSTTLPPPPPGSVSVTTYTTTLPGGSVSTVISSTTLPPPPPGSISLTTYTTTLPGGSVSTLTSSTTLPPPPPPDSVSSTTYVTTLPGGSISTVTSATTLPISTTTPIASATTYTTTGPDGSPSTVTTSTTVPPPPPTSTPLVSQSTYTTTGPDGSPSTVITASTIPPPPPISTTLVSQSTYTTTGPDGLLSTVTTASTVAPPPPPISTPLVSQSTFTTTGRDGSQTVVTTASTIPPPPPPPPVSTSATTYVTTNPQGSSITTSRTTVVTPPVVSTSATTYLTTNSQGSVITTSRSSVVTAPVSSNTPPTTVIVQSSTNAQGSVIVSSTTSTASGPFSSSVCGGTYVDNLGTLYHVDCGTAYPGSDLPSVTVSDFESCCEACDNYVPSPNIINGASCVAFTYGARNVGGECYLKYNVTQTRSAGGQDSCYKIGSTVRPPVSSSAAVASSNTVAPSSSVASSNTVVSSNPASPPASGTSSNPAIGSTGTSSSQSSATSISTGTGSTSTSTPWCGVDYTDNLGVTYHVDCGYAYPGNDLPSVITADEESCFEACDNYIPDPNIINGAPCVAVTFGARTGGGACYLKYDVTTIRTANGQTSGYQVGRSGGPPAGSSNSVTTSAPGITSTTNIASTRVSSSATSSTSVNSVVAFQPCPSSNGQTWIDPRGTVFDISCNCEYPGNDLTTPHFDYFEDCITACDDYVTDPNVAGGADCVAATWSYGNPGGNCFLKYAIGEIRCGNPNDCSAKFHNYTVPSAVASSSTSIPYTSSSSSTRATTTSSSTTSSSSSTSTLSTANTASSAIPTVTGTPSCPSNNGSIYTDTFGQSYYIHCGQKVDGNNARPCHADTWERCAAFCDILGGCQAVTYPGPADSTRTNCYPYSTFRFYSTASQPDLLSAVPVNGTTGGQFANSVALCPGYNGQQFLDATGRAYTVRCDWGLGLSNLAATQTYTLEACLTHCSIYGSCQGVTFTGYTAGSRNLNCYPQSNYAVGGVQAGNSSAQYIS
ncbi:MAG: hypothetical protein Q9222_003635 [Ikaeria aurantiellina]